MKLTASRAVKRLPLRTRLDQSLEILSLHRVRYYRKGARAVSFLSGPGLGAVPCAFSFVRLFRGDARAAWSFEKHGSSRVRRPGRRTFITANPSVTVLARAIKPKRRRQKRVCPRVL